MHACRPGACKQEGMAGHTLTTSMLPALLFARREVPIYCLPPCTGRRTNPVDMDGMTAVQVRLCLRC